MTEFIEVVDQRPSFTFIHTCVIDDERLNPIELATYVILCSIADSETAECEISIEKLAEKVGCSDNTVRKYLQTLEQLGYIRIDRTMNSSNVYTLLEPKNREEQDMF